MSIPSNFCSCGSLKHRVDDEIICLKCRKEGFHNPRIDKMARAFMNTDTFTMMNAGDLFMGEPMTEEEIEQAIQYVDKKLWPEKRRQEAERTEDKEPPFSTAPPLVYKGDFSTEEIAAEMKKNKHFIEYQPESDGSIPQHVQEEYAKRQQEAAQQEAKATAVDMRRRYEDARAQQMSMPFGGLNQFQVLKSDYLARGSGKI